MRRSRWRSRSAAQLLFSMRRREGRTDSIELGVVDIFVEHHPDRARLAAKQDAVLGHGSPEGHVIRVGWCKEHHAGLRTRRMCRIASAKFVEMLSERRRTPVVVTEAGQRCAQAHADRRLPGCRIGASRRRASCASAVPFGSDLRARSAAFRPAPQVLLKGTAKWYRRWPPKLPVRYRVQRGVEQAGTIEVHRQM